MSFPLGDLPRELVVEIAVRLDNSSLANLSQTCKNLNELLGPETNKRARQIALAPRHVYEQQYEYAADQNEGIDEPSFVFDRPLLETGYAPVHGEILGKAVLSGNLDLAKFFLGAGVNPNAYIVAGTRMLSLVVQSMNIMMVSLLLQFGANPLFKNIIEDISPLEHAVQRLQNDIVEMFINACTDLTEFNVLGRMVRVCNAHVLNLCINRGADFSAVGVAGYTVLHYLVVRNNQDIFNLVMPHVPASVLNAVTTMGQTALHLAMLNTNPWLVGPLLSLGLDMNVRDNMGYTVFHIALKKRHFLLAYDLLARGCQLGFVNQEGETELHLAVQSRQVDIVRRLLHLNVDINAHNANADTPLHNAVRLCDMALVNVLLTEGSTQPDLQIQDRDGRTALQEALNLGETAIAQLFPEIV